MLDGLLKSKFYTKCKSLIKMTKTRLDTLTKKKCSVAKFLKNDMADLLRSRLDYNAYCRAEGLLVEQKMIACYNFIDQFCGCISSNLTVMNKQRECPEECREAVQSLIYAAARIAELPELRDLRTVFAERYENCLEAFVNKEFVETLKPTPATKEMKLQLMHDIATEFNIEWNPKSLEQKLFQPPSSAQYGQRRHESLSNGDDEAGYQWKKKNDDDDEKCNNIPIRRSSEDEVFSADRRDSTDMDSVQACSSSVGSVSEDEVDSKKPFYYKFIPPPYVRTKGVKEESKIESPSTPDGNALSEETTHQDDLVNEAKPKPKSVRRRPAKSTQPQENTDQLVERPLKPPPGREMFLSNGGGGWFGKANAGTEKEAAAPKPGWRFAQAEDGDDKRDEEEKMLDGLLMRYCKDKEMIPASKASGLRTNDDNVGAMSRRKVKSELPLPPGRSAEQAASPNKATTRHTRAVSLQPEMMGAHVHPKLPDCDDLAARIAALRGR